MARQFQHSFEVCTCKHVTLGEIIHGIKEKDAKTVEEIGEITDAGTACGCCRCKDDDFTGEQQLYLKEIVDKFID